MMNSLGTVLFFSLRAEKEGLDEHTLVRELGLGDNGEDALTIDHVGAGDYKPVEIHDKNDDQEDGVV